MSVKQRLFSYIKDKKKNIAIAIISIAFYILAQLSIPLLVGYCLDCIGTIKNGVFIYTLDENITLFTTYIIIGFTLAIIGSIFDYIYEYQIGKMTQKIVYRIRTETFNKLNSVPIKVIDENRHGDLLQLVILDIENVANGFFSVFKQLILGILSIIVTIIMMFTVNFILAIAVIILSPLSLFMSRFVATFTHRHFKKQASIQATLNALSLETIENQENVQALNYSTKAIKRFKEYDDKLQAESRVAQFSSSWVNPSTRFVNNTIYALIGIAGIIMIIYTASYPILNMTIGKLTSFLSYTNEYTKPFNEISSVISEFETARSSFIRINNFLNLEDDIDEGKEEIHDIHEITFDHLDFSYEKDRQLIVDFNKTIQAKKKVAIVGPTGAGKTTLINLLMRFYDPDKGALRYDNVDARDIKKSSLRANFAMVLQDTWIFNGTILDNVRYSNLNASDEECIKACKIAHADSFINTLPEGYHTVVSSKSGLSEGERQLITIARAVLKNADIVILDEATSNVDTYTEKLITDAFDTLMKDRTSIVIAHRLSTIISSDLILVLKDGNVVESGNHHSLLKEKGLYYSLYTSQFK